MGIKLELGSDTIEVISSMDESVKCDDAAYDQYAESLDEDLLELDPEIEPTRFVLKRRLPYKLSKRLKDQSISMGKSSEDINLKLGFMMDDVRYSLVDIKNGGDALQFRKAGDGFAHEELMQILSDADILSELYTAKKAASRAGGFSKKS